MSCKLDLSFIIPGFINTNITVKGLKGNGEVYGKLEKSHRLGMTSEQCANGMIKGLRRRKRQIIVGKIEVILLYIDRISPVLSRSIVSAHPMKKFRNFKSGLKSGLNFIPRLVEGLLQKSTQGKVAHIFEKNTETFTRKIA